MFVVEQERRCPDGNLQAHLSRCVPLFTRTVPLRELHLWGNQIGDAGAVALANALVFNRGLQVFLISTYVRCYCVVTTT